MKKIDKNAYRETRTDKSHLMIIGWLIALVSIAMLVGGGWLVVKGIMISGIWATIWRIVLGLGLVLLGVSFGAVSIMMISTSFSMIKVKDGNVRDVGNSAMGTVNVAKCDKCGAKLEDGADFCQKCGDKIDGVKKCECGHNNSIEAKHCIKCGKELK